MGIRHQTLVLEYIVNNPPYRAHGYAENKKRGILNSNIEQYTQDHGYYYQAQATVWGTTIGLKQGARRNRNDHIKNNDASHYMFSSNPSTVDMHGICEYASSSFA